MMQICAFGDGDQCRSEVSGVILTRLLSPSSQPPALKPFFHYEGVNCHFF